MFQNSTNNQIQNEVKESLASDNTLTPELILSTIKSCFNHSCFDHISESSISLHEPSFGGNEWAYVKDCIDSGWVSSVGKYVDLFEIKLAEYTGVQKAIATVNGTSALHMCLLLADVKADDEVLMPTLTFIATANAIRYCNAIPHFVDCSEITLGIDPVILNEYLLEIAEVRNGQCFNKKTGRRIKALIAMHTFGHPNDLDPLLEICQKYKITLIEDAAESLGSFYRGRHTGNWGKLSALSFNGNKTITTGGGGAILTNDLDLAKKAKHLTTTARIPSNNWEFLHDEVGYNYRLPNINAALGCAQLEDLDQLLSKKRILAARYQKAFQDIKGLKFFVESNFAKSNYWLNAIILDSDQVQLRNEILQLTNNAGISTRPVWTLIHKLAMYENYPKMDLSISENLEKRIINIPSSSSLA